MGGAKYYVHIGRAFLTFLVAHIYCAAGEHIRHMLSSLGIPGSSTTYEIKLLLFIKERERIIGRRSSRIRNNHCSLPVLPKPSAIFRPVCKEEKQGICDER